MESVQELLSILKHEVKHSLGCSGPVGVALAACEAYEAVGGRIKKIYALVDKDMCSKNSDVGIPPLGVKGLKNAAALGALCGRPGCGLEVLSDATQDDVALAVSLADSGCVEVTPDWDIIGVYTDVRVVTDKGEGRAVVARTHSNVVYKEANGRAIFGDGFSREKILDESKDTISRYSLSDIVNFSLEADSGDLEFLKEAIRLNRRLCDYGLSEKSKSPGFGRSMLKRMADIPLKKAKAMTCAASEARMEGTGLEAMSCATSGNAGIAVCMPLLSLAEDYEKSEQDLLRALACGYLVTISCKNKIGRHSAMCACAVAASLGVAAGTAMLFGGGLKEVEMAVNNTIVNVFGILCDGARTACALKLSTAAECAMDGAFMALDGVEVNKNEGVCAETADRSMEFMGKFARTGMAESDLMLCRALYEKHF